MKKYKVLGLLIIIFLTISCDGITGLEGVVVDSQSDERLKEVSVQMTSNYDVIETITDINGYFSAIDRYSCGGSLINKCDESFSIIFNKDGYEILQMEREYASFSDTEDTLVVELIPIQ